MADNCKQASYYVSRMKSYFRENCYLISRGVRSCYTEIVIGPEDSENAFGFTIADLIGDLEQIALHYDLHMVWFRFKDESQLLDGMNGYDVWVYRYHHQRPVIEALTNAPKSYLTEWVMGKLLGYSDESMEEFLTQHVMAKVETDASIFYKASEDSTKEKTED